MANPTSTTRGSPLSASPSSPYMREGHSTKISFHRGASGTTSFWKAWEREVQPPGVDSGDAIDITTMHNVTWESMYPSVLKTLTPFSVILAYSLEAMDEAISVLVGRNGSITCHFPGTDKLDLWGFMQNFVPQSHKKRELPLANCQIVPTNYDDANFTEAGPVLTLATGSP